MIKTKIQFHDSLPQYIADGLIKVQRHPTKDLYIYNYTPKCQYESAWDEVTLNCRGLILDGEGTIIARPFPKFFNMEEHDFLPEEPYKVLPKMDGSLGILYHYGGEWHIASRGSFTSDQSREANCILQGLGLSNLNLLNKKYTYLFEIIYPENKIVVDYGDVKKLVHLATINKETGEDVEDMVAPTLFNSVYSTHAVDILGKMSPQQLKAMNTPNAEGFVLKYESGTRVKIKFEEYIRLHAIITGVSSYSVWEILRTGGTLKSILDRVPDEFYSWVKELSERLLNYYSDVEQCIREDFYYRPDGDRKQVAEYFKGCKYPHLLFAMLDDKDVKEAIWNLVKPEFQKPFSTGDDNDGSSN